MADVEALVAAAREHDVVIAQELPPVVLERLRGRPARLVADLYNPIVVEVLAGVAGRPPAERRRIHGRIVARTLGAAAPPPTSSSARTSASATCGSAAWRSTG